MRRRLNEIYSTPDGRNRPENHSSVNSSQPPPHSAQLEPASMDFLGQPSLNDLMRLGFPLSESSAHDAGAVSQTNGDMTSQSVTMEHALDPTTAGESFGFRDFSSQTRRNREDTHNSVNPPQPSRDLLSHASGVNLGDLDCDEAVHNTSPHPQVDDGNTTSMEDFEGEIEAFNINPGTDSR